MKNGKILLYTKSKKFTFYDIEESDELGKLISELWKKEVSEGTGEPITKKKSKNDNTGFFMDQNDWELIVNGGNNLNFNEGDVILKEGVYLNRIYQIEKGHCIIQKEVNEKTIIITTLGPTAIFGEMSFLSKSPASASVVADVGGVSVVMIEGHYINSTFVKKPYLAANYFSFLAETLSHKLHLTEKKN